jgi:hypothetical protein
MKEQMAGSLKAHFKGVCSLILLLTICLMPFALARRTIWRAPANIITVTNLNGQAEGGPCQYTITFGTHTIVPGSTDTGNHCAWGDTMINLPFPFVLYDQTFDTVMVNSSGRLDFICDNEPSGHTETCLPAPPHNCPYDYTIFALWGEWYTGSGVTGCSTWANGCGIFTSVSGSQPNRVFNIEWHAVRRENDALTANFEVRLYENDPNKRFDIIYGVIEPYPFSPNLYTAGVQGSTGFFSQDFCNVPPPQNVSSTLTRCYPAPLRHPLPRRRPGLPTPMTAGQVRCARRSPAPTMATPSFSILS